MTGKGFSPPQAAGLQPKRYGVRDLSQKSLWFLVDAAFAPIRQNRCLWTSARCVRHTSTNSFPLPTQERELTRVLGLVPLALQHGLGAAHHCLATPAHLPLTFSARGGVEGHPR